MPTRAQIAPILTGILLLGWLFHPSAHPRHSNSKKTTWLDASRLKSTNAPSSGGWAGLILTVN